MADPKLLRTIGKLALAGEQAGFSIDEMIDMLNSGISVSTLLALIASRLGEPPPLTPPLGSFPHWVN
jgi:hypothetical protein